MSVPDGLDERAAGARLGSHIRMLRKTRGLTLVQLAERTQLSHPFLSQLERGLEQPSLGSLRRIAIALETSKGNLALALALGLILVLVAIGVNALAAVLGSATGPKGGQVS